MAATETDPPAGVLPTRRFPGEANLGALVVPPDADTVHYSDMLKAGCLVLQQCSRCRRCRYPIAPVCPYCLSDAFDWLVSRGTGRVVSWVRYHRNYLPEFERLMPYVVVCVELAEGPRLFGRLADSVKEPHTGMPVTVIIEVWDDGGRAPAFVPAGPRL